MGESMKKNRLSVLTLHNIHNYGSILQAIATKEIFETNSIDVEFVNYYRKDSILRNRINSFKDRSVIKRAIKLLVLIPTEIRYIYLWTRIGKKYISNTKKKYYNLESLLANPPVANAFCVGSDQVWNSVWNNGILKEFFLEYAPINAFRFSFSSSFGHSKLEGSELSVIKQYLDNFNALSVRESSAKEILDSIGLNKVALVLDPTLIIGYNVWKKYISERKIKRNYILVYQLQYNEFFESYIKFLSKSMKLDIVRIQLRYDQISQKGKKVFLPSVENFLSLFNHADYIVTDSFHGTSFALNFNKQFSVCLPQRFSERITSILNITKLSNRIITPDTNFKNFDNDIDYGIVNKLLEQQRQESFAFVEYIKNKVDSSSG